MWYNIDMGQPSVAELSLHRTGGYASRFSRKREDLFSPSSGEGGDVDDYLGGAFPFLQPTVRTDKLYH